MKILKGSNSTPLNGKLVQTHLHFHPKNGLKRQMLLVSFQNLIVPVALLHIQTLLLNLLLGFQPSLIEQNRCAIACQGCGIAIFYFIIGKFAKWRTKEKGTSILLRSFTFCVNVKLYKI